MIQTTSIAGGVEPSLRCSADFPGLITGTVGTRDRGEWIDMAFFGPVIAVGLPLSGTLDGRPARVVAVASRELADAPIGRTSAAATRAITATVILDH